MLYSFIFLLLCHALLACRFLMVLVPFYFINERYFLVIVSLSSILRLMHLLFRFTFVSFCLCFVG